jgi:hypothetical protein
MSFAIQVKDKGCFFRSKLEWRYAEFFDQLGIPWVHEPATFDLTKYVPSLPKSKRWYLPDFYLPTFDCYLEVKPRIRSGIPRLRLEALGKVTGKIVLMSENFYKFPPEFWWFNPLKDSLAKLPRDHYAKFYICSSCRGLGLTSVKDCSCRTRPNFQHHLILHALAKTLEPLPNDKIHKGRISRRPKTI